MNTPVENTARPRKVGAIGWGLIVLAFLIPISSAALGYSGAAQAG